MTRKGTSSLRRVADKFRAAEVFALGGYCPAALVGTGAE